MPSVGNNTLDIYLCWMDMMVCPWMNYREILCHLRVLKCNRLGLKSLWAMYLFSVMRQYWWCSIHTMLLNSSKKAQFWEDVFSFAVYNHSVYTLFLALFYPITYVLLCSAYLLYFNHKLFCHPKCPDFFFKCEHLWLMMSMKYYEIWIFVLVIILQDYTKSKVV